MVWQAVCRTFIFAHIVHSQFPESLENFSDRLVPDQTRIPNHIADGLRRHASAQRHVGVGGKSFKLGHGRINRCGQSMERDESISTQGSQ